MIRQASGNSTASSLLLAEKSEIDDQANDDDIDRPLVSTFAENLVQSVPDGIEVEQETKNSDREQCHHPQLDFKRLLLVHVLFLSVEVTRHYTTHFVKKDKFAYILPLNVNKMAQFVYIGILPT